MDRSENEGKKKGQDMKRIKLSGDIPFSELRKGTKPEYLFLPEPTHVLSELEETSIRYVERHHLNITWKACWVGDRLCKEVLDRSQKNLEQNLYLDRIYQKIRPLLKKRSSGDKDMLYLIRENEKRIKKWKMILDKLEKQMEG